MVDWPVKIQVGLRNVERVLEKTHLWTKADPEMTMDGKWREASRMVRRRLSAADLWRKARRNTKDLWRKKKKERKEPTGTKTAERGGGGGPSLLSIQF
jgi:hypothetical protein